MKKQFAIVAGAVLLSACVGIRHHKLYEGDPAHTAYIDSFDTVLIDYVDNDNMGTSFIGQKHTYDIKAGQHTLLVKYSDIFDTGSGEHDIVESRPAKITFVAEPGKHYQIRNPVEKKLQDAKKLEQKPEFWVVELSTGKRIPATVEMSRPRSFFEGLKMQNKPAYEFASDRVQPAEGDAGNGTAAADMSNLQRLQQSWSGASQDERDAFLKWIKTN